MVNQRHVDSSTAFVHVRICLRGDEIALREFDYTKANFIVILKKTHILFTVFTYIFLNISNYFCSQIVLILHIAIYFNFNFKIVDI